MFLDSFFYDTLCEWTKHFEDEIEIRIESVKIDLNNLIKQYEIYCLNRLDTISNESENFLQKINNLKLTKNENHVFKNSLDMLCSEGFKYETFFKKLLKNNKILKKRIANEVSRRNIGVFKVKSIDFTLLNYKIFIFSYFFIIK